MDGDARKLGERLLGEVESEGLSELFASLRELSLPPNQLRFIFGFDNLDALLPRPQHHHLNAQNQQVQSIQHPDQDAPNSSHHPVSLPPPQQTSNKPQPLTIDLTSSPYSNHPSGSGKSTLAYLLTMHAILPESLLGTSLRGAASSVVFVDPLGRFRASRLAEFMLHHLTSTLETAGRHDVHADDSIKREVLACVKEALKHVHVFRPAGWEELLATLDELPGYLLDDNDDNHDNEAAQPDKSNEPKPRHPSADRTLHAIIIEDVHTFTPHLRALPPTSTSTSTSSSNSSPLSLLTPHIRALHASLHPSCILLTSLSTSPPPPRSTSTAVPAKPPASSITRLAVHRASVPKFAMGISVEEAGLEQGMRGEVVRRGRFEVWRVGGGGGGEEGAPAGRGGGVVGFRIRGTGDVVFE